MGRRLTLNIIIFYNIVKDHRFLNILKQATHYQTCCNISVSCNMSHHVARKWLSLILVSRLPHILTVYHDTFHRYQNQFQCIWPCLMFYQNIIFQFSTNFLSVICSWKFMNINLLFAWVGCKIKKNLQANNYCIVMEKYLDAEILCFKQKFKIVVDSSEKKMKFWRSCTKFKFFGSKNSFIMKPFVGHF